MSYIPTIDISHELIDPIMAAAIAAAKGRSTDDRYGFMVFGLLIQTAIVAAAKLSPQVGPYPERWYLDAIRALADAITQCHGYEP